MLALHLVQHLSNEMNNLAFIFPGQGSQTTGMGKDLYSNYKIAKTMYQQADDFLIFHYLKSHLKDLMNY